MEQQTAKRFGALIVPVSDLGPLSEGRRSVTVDDFTNLAGLARFLERPILYEVDGRGERTFAVDDDVLRYVTAATDRRRRGAREERPPEGPHLADPLRGSAPTERASGRHFAVDERAFENDLGAVVPAERRSVRSLATRGGLAVLVVAVGATLTLSFTASTTVPASYVGQTVAGVSVAQRTPIGCSSLALTGVASGSGRFSNGSSRTLILGSAGDDQITATGQYNCIVGGGGRDVVLGTASDVCIIGPTAGSIYSGCAKKAR